MTDYAATRDWPFAEPFEWYRDIVRQGEAVEIGEWYGAVNVLRWAAGLAPVGHRQTYDFFVAMRSVKRLAGWHKQPKNDRRPRHPGKDTPRTPDRSEV